MKLLAATGTAAFWVKLLVGSVSQGVTEVVVIPVKLKVWFTATLLPLTATMKNCPDRVFLKAEIETPAEGLAVAEISEEPGLTNRLQFPIT